MNPYESPLLREDAPTPRPAWPSPPVSRWRLFGECVLLSVCTSVVATVITTWLWNEEEIAAGTLEEYRWLPMHDLRGMLTVMPLGMAIHCFVPTGWLFWVGCALGVWKRQRAYFLLSLLGTIGFGLVWPRHFVALMGI